MTPEARQRRRIRTPVLAVTAVAWAVTLFADPLRSASGAGQGLAAAAAEARLAHAGHAHHAVVDAASHVSTENIAGLLIGWALMLTAMMAPLLIPALRHVHARSLRSRRWRAVSLVTVAHAAGLDGWRHRAPCRGVSAAVGLRARGPRGAGRPRCCPDLAAVTAQAGLPQQALCASPISSFGAAADRDALRFGGTHAAWCLGSCWALMLVSLLAPGWHLAVMLVVSVWMWVEPLDRPRTADLAGTPPAAFPAHRRRDGPIPAPACVAIRAVASKGPAGLAGPGGLAAGVSRSGRLSPVAWWAFEGSSMPSRRGLRRARPPRKVTQHAPSASTRTPARWSNHAAPRPAGPACRSSHAPVLTAWPSSSRSNRVISRTVTPLPHQSTASRTDKPSSSVIVRSACPARRSASRIKASRSPSAVSTATANLSSRRSRSARSLRSTAWASNADRRAACLTDC